MADVRLIDANALHREIYIWMENSNKASSYADAVEGFAYSEVLDAINIAPTIDPESLRPVAQWEEDDYAFNQCSNCGWEWDEAEYKTAYCPNCGAKMEGEE